MPEKKININETKHTIRTVVARTMGTNDEYMLNEWIGELKELGITTTINGKKVTFSKPETRAGAQ